VFYQDTSKPPEDFAKFQLSIILHAFKFPKATRIVYSTCSIHQQENEDVVFKALQSNTQWKLSPAFPDWKRRGNQVFPGSENCLRASPEEDNTLGFFVACFERK
jgi:25S rRNA (cytosine2278-C5)-methyltransferase